MIYLVLNSGQLTTRLKTLLPNVINPEALGDDELLALGIKRATITKPTPEWWQRHGEPVIDSEATPATVTHPLESISLEEVKERAWGLVKEGREVRQQGLMPFSFPSGDLHHIEFTERAKADLTAQTTAAIGMLVAGIPGTLVWTVYENVTHQLTPTQMLTLGFTAGQWQGAIHAQSQTIRDAIYAATDVEGVIAAAVWPEL